MLGALACGGADTSVQDLVVQGSAAAEDAGRLVELVVHDASGLTVASDATSVLDGDFSLGVVGVLDEGSVYEVLVYLDRSDNLACDTPPADLGWRLSTGSVEGLVTLDVPAAGSDDVCAAFIELP